MGGPGPPDPPSYATGWSFFFTHGVCPHVRPSQKQENVLQRQDKILATTGAMSENNENLLAVAWWVILNSPDLFLNYLQR